MSLPRPLFPHAFFATFFFSLPIEVIGISRLHALNAIIVLHVPETI